jgi:hypothetical protein
MDSSFDRSGDSLPMAPATAEDFRAWKRWAAACAEQRRWPETGRPITWRAMLANWANESVDPEAAAAISYQLLLKAHEAPPYAVRAAQQLLAHSVATGATSADVLFLTAAFAWPLRDLLPADSATAWAHLVRAAWQTDAATLVKLCTAIEATSAQVPARRLVDLAAERLDDGQRTSARELLEAMVLVQCGCKRIDQLSLDALSRKPALKDIDLAVVRLARLYVEDGDDGGHARDVLHRAAAIEGPTARFQATIEQRVWDRSFAEVYAWAKDRQPREIEAEIKRIKPTQPHHARRLAEAILVGRYSAPRVRSPVLKVHDAIRSFEKASDKDILEHHSSRCAAEHLAVLLVETNQSTEHGRQFVTRILGSVGFVGKGASLNAVRDDLERFVNHSDPYHLLRAQEREIENAGGALGDEEKRVGNIVNEWFSRQSGASRPTLDRVISAVTSPISDATSMISDLVPGIEGACHAAFRVMVARGPSLCGDLDLLRAEGAALADGGISRALLDRARAATRMEQLIASGASGTAGLLPPGMSLAASAADLGVTLLATYRALARIGALFGLDVATDDGFRFVADSFALGCSSSDKEGIAAYLSRDKQPVLTELVLGGVAYGGAAVMNYLWTARGNHQRLAEQVIANLARICGIGLSQGALAKLVPIGGAVVAAASTYAFMESIIDAAIHLAAREALLRKLGSTSTD